MDAYVCIYSCRCARAGGRVCVSVCSHKFVCACVSLCIFIYVNICVCIPTSTCAWIKNNINKPIKNIKISHLIHQLTKHIKKASFSFPFFHSSLFSLLFFRITYLLNGLVFPRKLLPSSLLPEAYLSERLSA